MRDQNPEFRMLAAKDGGFIVSRSGDYRGEFSSPMFAGELQPALDYLAAAMKAALSDAPSTGADK